MCFLSVIFAIDPSRKQLDCASICQQALVELLIGGFKDVDLICGGREAPDKVEEWQGVDW